MWSDKRTIDKRTLKEYWMSFQTFVFLEFGATLFVKTQIRLL